MKYNLIISKQLINKNEVIHSSEFYIITSHWDLLEILYAHISNYCIVYHITIVLRETYDMIITSNNIRTIINDMELRGLSFNEKD